jgi:glycosyltransferase 2 family protein
LTEYVDSPISRTKRRVLILVALSVAVIYVGATVLTDTSKAQEALAQLGWAGCILVLALSALNYILRFYRWQNFLARLGRVLPTPLHLLYYISGFAFTVSPAKVGEAFRSVHLREHGVAYSESLAALFAERLLDLVAMCVLASLIALERATYRPLIAGVTIIGVVLLAMACHPFLPRRLQSISDASTHPHLAKPLATLANLLQSSHLILQPKPATFGLAIGLVSWGAEGLGLFLICQGLHLNVAAPTAIGIYAIASLAGSAAFFLPAGIGGMEIVMTTLLVAHGAPLRTAVVATLLCRIATLWFAVLIGVAASAIVEFQLAPRHIRSAS